MLRDVARIEGRKGRPGSGIVAVRVGQPPAYITSFYTKAVLARWRVIIPTFLGAYLIINTLFALLYMAGGDCVEGARDPGSFRDSLHLSVQTISTIGYGTLGPKGDFANAVVFLESAIGILLTALVTGLVFAKFARPVAGTLFSDRMLIMQRNGKPCLCFRVANARSSEIIEASIKLTAIVTEKTAEGDTMRRLHDLNLVRSTTPVLVLSWLVMHEIDESSPLFEMTPEDWVKEDVRIVVSLTGIDGTYSQTIFSYEVYQPDEIIFGHEFEDVLRPIDRNRIELDLTKFHAHRPQKT